MRWLTSAMTAVAVTVALTGAGQAQVVEKKTLTLEGARQVVATAIGEARRLNAPGAAIAVVDDGGNLVALERLDGTFAAGANISIGKARTAAIFKRPTKAFEDAIGQNEVRAGQQNHRRSNCAARAAPIAAASAPSVDATTRIRSA